MKTLSLLQPSLRDLEGRVSMKTILAAALVLTALTSTVLADEKY
jgi:hypothetical protein